MVMAKSLADATSPAMLEDLMSNDAITRGWHSNHNPCNMLSFWLSTSRWQLITKNVNKQCEWRLSHLHNKTVDVIMEDYPNCLGHTELYHVSPLWETQSGKMCCITCSTNKTCVSFLLRINQLISVLTCLQLFVIYMPIVSPPISISFSVH